MNHCLINTLEDESPLSKKGDKKKGTGTFFFVPIIQVMYIEMAIGKEVNMKPFHNERLNFE